MEDRVRSVRGLSHGLNLANLIKGAASATVIQTSPPIINTTPSDVRLKRDIVLLGRLPNGIGLYRYRYVWSDQPYVGVMAQEVARIIPDAVVQAADGFLRVNYARLGMRLLTWDEWVSKRSEKTTVAAGFLRSETQLELSRPIQ